MSIFILRGTPPPWGGYGAVLMNGMSRRLARDADGIMQLERPGPYVPPITFPTVSEVVITSDFRKILERAPLSGLSFQPVRVATAVSLPWETWDRSQRFPPRMPASGEPSDYLPAGSHDSECAKRMGQLWELKAPSYGHGSSRMVSLRKYAYDIDVPAERTDFFRAKGLALMLVSESARDWLSQAVGEWVTFEPIRYN